MLEKKYNPEEVEKTRYDWWLEHGYFKAGDKSKPPFCVVIPPPNVTGKLHIGHAWDTTLQDIIIRYKRMDGYDALWLPGMDHAGIATQAKVDQKLKQEGIEPRSMDRNNWLKHAWAWKNEYAQNIHEQWKVLGLSLDYTRERFTLDDGLSKAVRKVFVDLYNEGLIYRGERIINWDPEARTALSNEEVIYKEVEGAFYHIKYMIDGEDGNYLEVATTRPETLFGDTAVAVNPKDERYQKYIGKNVILPIVNKKIPVVADIHADPEFGTGVVKITPAHDPNDYQVGLRHNLPRVVVMNPDATMNENAGKYQGMDRFACREALVKDLQEAGLLIKIKKIMHSVGHSERTGVMVEPYLSKQWFVKMRPLADAVLANQKKKDKKVNFVPARFEKIMNHWMTITYDWCISRQLWWGHRIPAWYKDGEVYVGMEAPEGEGWTQDEDVLDTWFSSALWPFSTLGWPEETEDFKRYYPNNVLVTGYDIIPFWVNRMTFQGLHFTGKRPFETCLIHGLVRDKLGRKMSKSLGNGVDPIAVAKEYGMDSLRFFLTTNSAPGMDLRYDEEKVKSTWNFINKLWNASRFVLMNVEGITDLSFDKKQLQVADKWILNELNQTIKKVRKSMDKYQFHTVGNMLYSFVWDDFCDWYIELAKSNMTDTTKKVLLLVLTDILKMLHPFMPYVTEEIYQALPVKDAESIMISAYPVASRTYSFASVSEDFQSVLDDIVSIRNLKANNNIKKENAVMISGREEYLPYFCSLLKISESTSKEGMQEVHYESKNVSVTYYLEEETIDKDAIKHEIETLEKSIARRENLLKNENYVTKAPANVVQLDRTKLQEEKEKLSQLKQKLS